jgi:Na+/serine symporter
MMRAIHIGLFIGILLGACACASGQGAGAYGSVDVGATH